MQVYKIDSKNFYTYETYFTDEPKENEISIYPCNFYKPRWDENKKQWFEGATKEEIEKWKEENQPDKTKIPPTTDELKEENERLWETVEFLLKQVNMIPKESERIE